MNDKPLMPKATAVWLVENTKISFKQIADFCDLHELEVKGIADGDVAKGIKSFKKGMSDNPNQAGSISSSEETSKTSEETSKTSEEASSEDQNSEKK